MLRTNPQLALASNGTMGFAYNALLSSANTGPVRHGQLRMIERGFDAQPCGSPE